MCRQMEDQMIDLYTWPTPNGHKIHIMVEECGLEYNIIPINIHEGDQFDPEFLEISPNNKMPAIVDHDGPGGKPIPVFETGAILIYLADKTGRFLPDRDNDPHAYYDVIQWLMFQMGGVGPMFGQAGHFRNYALERFSPEAVQYGIDRYTNEAKRLYNVMDRRLDGREWIAGNDYSIADIAIFPWCRTPERRGVDHNDYPNCSRWFDRVAARPAVQRGVKVLEEHRRAGPHSDKSWEMMFGARQYARR